MKKSILILFFGFYYIGFSQTHTEKIQTYLNTNYQKLGLTNQDINDWIVESTANSKSTNINNYYIKQRHQEIEIFGAVSNISIKNDQVLAIGNRFISNVNQKINTTTPTLSVLEALQRAKLLIEITNSESNTTIKKVSPKKFIISNGNLDPIKAQLVYQKIGNHLHLAWDFKIDVPSHNHLWSIRIDAVDGKLLNKNDLVISCNFDTPNIQENKNFCFLDMFKNNKNKSTVLDVLSGSYRVFPYTIESPNHGSRQLINSPSNTIASPYGWHNVDGTEYTITRGNNVYAFGDLDNTDSGLSPDGGASLIFDFPYAGNNVPALNYLDAATTNLFYMNNILHDVFYNYGFDEANGNFQSNNFDNGGIGDDYVFAQSQDGGGINNANFGTPPDGENGRMQMYLWNRKTAQNLITVNLPATIAGSYTAIDNSFVLGHVDLPITPANLTANLVLYDDGNPDNSDACEPAINSTQLNGKIAIIKRGVCNAAIKVINAQNAGAIAVIIINNIPNNYYISGSDISITIPTISVTQTVGNLLLSQMEISTVNISLSTTVSDFVNTDSDFDNMIISHEYGHGITNRLTGGSFNADCLNNQEQMGEGWSDWFGLMLQMKPDDFGAQQRGVGTYVSNQLPTDIGIRPFPYSTDMIINPLTFVSTNVLTRPHGVGSVWATMLWDLAWAYVDKYGFDSNIYNGNGGNNKVIQVVIDALKLQPCSPGFVDGRDAIIAADLAITGGQDYCMIWEVFARRGLGVNASSGDQDSSEDQIEDFTIPSPGVNCTLALDYFQNEELIKVYPNPSKGIININIAKFVSKINLQIIDINGRFIFDKKEIDFNCKKEIDLQILQSGVYVLKINSESINIAEKIIIE